VQVLAAAAAEDPELGCYPIFVNHARQLTTTPVATLSGTPGQCRARLDRSCTRNSTTLAHCAADAITTPQ
jgi:hypothetical protein